MLARITGILGPFPEQVLAAGKESNKYFTTSGVVYERVDDNTVSLVYPRKTTLASRLHLPTPCVDREDLLFQDIVRQMLHLDPSKRPSATQLLQHPWLDGADELCIPVPNLTVNPPPAPAYEEEDDREGERDDDAEDESGDGPLNYSFGDEDDNAEVDELSEEELSEEAILEVDSGGVEN